MTTPPPPAIPPAFIECHYRSCGVVGPNVPKLNCYAPGCDGAFHLYCYDLLGVLCKNSLGHFNDGNPEHSFLNIACKKECYRKAMRQYANMVADPERIFPGIVMVV
jgi:hypothetical protein